MQTFQKVDEQLKRLNINYRVWGKAEAKELCNILRPDEVIEECTNGYYEAGFAMLLATKDRVLLVDKKPFNYLTVEDMRFDMITELDYSHRLIGAQIKINAGYKSLNFTSWNQLKLRRLMTYIQNRMSEIKLEQQQHQDEQKRHLEMMNKQLEMYLRLQQFHQQQAMQKYYQDPAAATNSQQSQQPTIEQLANAEIFGRQESLQLGGAAVLEQHNQQPQQENRESLYRRYVQSLAYLTPQEVAITAAKRVLPVINAHTRLPLNRRPTQTQSATT